MEQGTIARAVEILRQGGVVAYPTDTFYGLAVDPRSDAAVARLYDAKGRDATVAIPLIAASIEQAEEAGHLTDAHYRLARAFWPGALTIVVEAAPSISRAILAGGTTIAVRVPAHPLARDLAAAFGCCITSTSANRSGEPSLSLAADVTRTLGHAIDMVIDGGPTPGGPPSTIVELTEAGPRLVRAGQIAWERVLRSLE
jgi:L-threonylcarbamoyladenylate synthase